MILRILRRSKTVEYGRDIEGKLLKYDDDTEPDDDDDDDDDDGPALIGRLRAWWKSFSEKIAPHARAQVFGTVDDYGDGDDRDQSVGKIS